MPKHHLDPYLFDPAECQHRIAAFRLNSFGNSIQCGDCGQHLTEILDMSKPGAWDRWLDFHAKRPDLVIRKAE